MFMKIHVLFSCFPFETLHRNRNVKGELQTKGPNKSWMKEALGFRHRKTLRVYIVRVHNIWCTVFIQCKEVELGVLDKNKHSPDRPFSAFYGVWWLDLALPVWNSEAPAIRGAGIAIRKGTSSCGWLSLQPRSRYSTLLAEAYVQQPAFPESAAFLFWANKAEAVGRSLSLCGFTSWS